MSSDFPHNMMDSPYHSSLVMAICVVREAAKLSKAVLADADKGVISKSDFSPVTIADFAIQALLTATLHNAFPEDTFVGEESAADLRAQPELLVRVWTLLKEAAASPFFPEGCRIPRDEEQMCEMMDWCGLGEPGPRQGEGFAAWQKKRTWVFDPIDGTQCFMRGQQYAINIALLQGGKQVMSVVGLPLLATDAQAPITDTTIDQHGRGSILFTVKGYGAHIRPLYASALSSPGPEPVPLPMCSTSLSGLRSVSSTNPLVGSGIDDAHTAICERLGVKFPGCDLLGWVPRYASMVLGHANMTVWVYKDRKRTSKIWDHAGAMLLYEEVGGKITDVFGKPIDLCAGRKLSGNFGFVAAPAALHAHVLKVVQEVLMEQGKWDALNIST